MTDELPELSNGQTDPFRKIPFKEFIAHSQNSEDVKQSPLQGFFRKIGDIFKGTQQSKEEHPLSGRISELHSSAEVSLLALISFKQKMETAVDPELYAFICSIIDPVIKEVTRIQQSIERDGNTAQKVKSFNRYVDWIEKANDWVEIGRQQFEEESIRLAVINQSVKDFQAKIDRDVRVVQDYLSHSMGELDLSDSLKNELKEKLMPELSPSLKELYNLRQPKADLTLEQFVNWRNEADNLREHLFSRALHIIDTFSEEFLPSPSKEIETGLALAGMTQLNYVESRISEMSLELEGDPPIDETRRNRYLDQLKQLSQEIHELNGNLHLTHEQHDRVQQSIESLAMLRERLT